MRPSIRLVLGVGIGPGKLLLSIYCGDFWQRQHVNEDPRLSVYNTLVLMTRLKLNKESNKQCHISQQTKEFPMPAITSKGGNDSKKDLHFFILVLY